jgi:FMN-dependent NADH-azoreductase
MPETLFINACARENSRTYELAKYVLDKLGGEFEEVNLYQADISPVGAEDLKGRAEAFGAKDFSDSKFDFARQFASKKTIVIAAPYWDLMFPSVLKIYFESITVSG